MESFAFWYKERSADDKASADQDAPSEVSAVMNFNLWCGCGWEHKKILSKVPKEKHPFLDIGFKITHLDSAEELYFFLPLRIDEKNKKEYIEDLGRKFKDTSLVDAVFNENYQTTISADSKTIDVHGQREKEEDSFKIYQLDIEHDISLSHFDTGTILTIKTDKIIYRREATDKNDTYYFRFRVKGIPMDFLIHKYSPPHFVLQSLFHTTCMVDFRYHNIRSLENSLIEKFYEKSHHIVHVESLHFLLMTKAYMDVSSNSFNSVRKIEYQVWRDYVNGHDTKDLVAYHFSDKAKVVSSNQEGEKTADSQNRSKKNFIESSELFAKFSIERSVIFWYVLITIFLGVVGSILGSWIFEFLKSFWVQMGAGI